MYEYGGTVVRVIDGDTLVVTVDLGFYLRQEMKLRLAGLDTPSIHGKDAVKGRAATEFVSEHLERTPSLGIRTYKIEKWGRYLADVYMGPADMKPQDVFKQGVLLNQLLLDSGLAWKYEG